MKTLRTSKPKAKKEHVCYFCNGKIDIGCIYEYQVTIHDNTLYTWKAHNACSDIASKLNMYEECDEGLTEADFVEYINNEFAEIIFKENVNLEVIPDFQEKLKVVIDTHLKSK